MLRLDSTIGVAFVLGFAGITAAVGSSTGCDGEDPDPCAAEIGADKCFQQSCVDPTSKTISFKTDVLPIFEQSCSLSASCHGNPSSPMTAAGYQPYLGEVNQEMTPSDVDKILMTIVDQPSPTSSMMIVATGAPESSFLMHKMDGDLECPALDCAGGDCLDTMPQGSSALPRETRDIVRAWIEQGAKNN